MPLHGEETAENETEGRVYIVSWGKGGVELFRVKLFRLGIGGISSP